MRIDEFKEEWKRYEDHRVQICSAVVSCDKYEITEGFIDLYYHGICVANGVLPEHILYVFGRRYSDESGKSG